MFHQTDNYVKYRLIKKTSEPGGSGGGGASKHHPTGRDDVSEIAPSKPKNRLKFPLTFQTNTLAKCKYQNNGSAF